MLEVLTAEYIKTAKAKGLRSRTIIMKHALRNGILPVVTYVGPMTANIVTGSSSWSRSSAFRDSDSTS
jgi:oligopeptide transport system permease protein